MDDWMSPEEAGFKTYRDYIAGKYGEELVYVIGDIDTEIDDWGYGIVYGKPFTAWSEEWVYFPAVYDGSEWVDRVPRAPCDIKTEHIGG